MADTSSSRFQVYRGKATGMANARAQHVTTTVMRNQPVRCCRFYSTRSLERDKEDETTDLTAVANTPDSLTSRGKTSFGSPPIRFQ